MHTRVLAWSTLPAAAALGLASLAIAPTADAATPASVAVTAAPMSAAGPLLRQGSRGAAVKTWQQNIDQVAGKIPGVPHIATDGAFGPVTASATRAFQRFAHVAVDGVVGPQTRMAMDTALHGAPTPSGPVLRQGSRGAAVRTWQQDIDRVAGKIPGVPHIATDGAFGPVTASATRAFQRFARIAVDGVVGPQTRQAMQVALHGAPAS